MESPSDVPPCPSCRAPRVVGPECPRCGVFYARAKGRAREVALAGAPPDELPSITFTPAVPFDELELARERMVRRFAMPAALLVAVLVTQSGMLHMLGRTFFSMWLHELGHAMAAWFTGFAAMPGPWRTMVGEERSLIASIFVLAIAATMARRALLTESRTWGILAGGVLLLHLVGRFLVPASAARTLVTFGGDAGMILLGTLLVALFPVGPDNVLRRNWLRWGFLVIGAFAFVDGAHTWIRAGWDVDAIPYGAIEGVGGSDPVKLTGEHGWSEGRMIARYQATVLVAGVAMAASWLRGLLQFERDHRPPE